MVDKTSKKIKWKNQIKEREALVHDCCFLVDFYGAADQVNTKYIAGA